MGELTLEDVQKDVRKVVFSWVKDYHDRQDVLQEALLIAWRAINDGVDDPAIIRGKARSYARQYLSKRGRTPTGSSTAGTVEGWEQESGKARREKIHRFMEDYRELHDKKAGPSEIAKGTGIPLRSVYAHLDKLYLFSGAMRKEDVTILSSDLNIGEGQGSEALNIIDQYKSVPSFEDDTLNRMVVQSAMNEVLTLTERHMLIRYIFQDETYRMIEHTEGLPTRHGIKKGVSRSLAKLRPVLEGVQ